MTHWLPVHAVVVMPIVQRASAHGLENITLRLTCDRSHRNGGVRRTECGGADSRNWRIKRTRKNRQTVNIAELTLICSHAKRGVALGVLNTLIAFLGSQLNIAHFHVVLIVQPHLRAQRDIRALGHNPYRCHRRLGHINCRRNRIFGFHLFAARSNDFGCTACTVSKACAQHHMSVRSTSNTYKRFAVVACWRTIWIRAEKLPVLIPRQLPTAM